MQDSELLNKMIVDFMSEQQKFNIEVIQRISKAEVRIYFMIFFVSTIISAGVSVLLKLFIN